MPAATVTYVLPSQLVNDCALTSLAMYLGVPYPDVYAAFRKLHPRRDIVKQGTTGRMLERTAGRLGTHLRFRTEFDPDVSYGILWARRHACLLRDGFVIESDGTQTVWEYDEWLAAKRQRIHGLYVTAD